MHYNHSNVQLAKNLRKNMTPWERKLWYCFLKTYSVRFQRQKSIDRYIVDFYCAKENLIVELDGSGHYQTESIIKDRERTDHLESLGYQIIRFSNLEIDKNFYGVCTVIDEAVKRNTLPQSASLTAPSEREPRLTKKQEDTHV